jgi:hypothetical protein
MSSRLSRRTLLAGVAALPALAVLGCESDRTTADPISTVNTLDFANRLRIPELADSTVDGDGVRVFRLGATAGSAEFLFRLAMTVARTSPSLPGSNGNRPGRSISLRRPCGITRIRTAKPNPR